MVLNEIISNLFDNDCIKRGLFKLRNGESSKYYFDMKNLISYPSLLKEIGDEIYNIIMKEEVNLICGVPIGGIPLCTYISTTYNIPMIIVRNEKKTYGTTKQIEGKYNKDDKCIIIEDVITTGSSIQNIVNILEDKVNIISSVVIIDRQQGYNLSIPLKSLITKTDITRFLLNKIMKDKKSRLCFSADIYDIKEILPMLDKVGPYIVICKLHLDCFSYENNEELRNSLIMLSNKHNFLLMEDRKFVDISSIVRLQYRAYSSWIDLVTVMGNVNPLVLCELSGALLVANMSNNNFDYTNTAVENYKKYPNNVIGFITQHRINEPNILCMTPGININCKSIDDQKYRDVNMVDTDIIIVGRGIYLNDNPVESCIKYSKL